MLNVCSPLQGSGIFPFLSCLKQWIQETILFYRIMSSNVIVPFRKWTHAPCSQKDQTRNRRWEDIVVSMVLARFAEVYSDENQLCLKINLLFWFSKETFAFYWTEIID